MMSECEIPVWVNDLLCDTVQIKPEGENRKVRLTSTEFRLSVVKNMNLPSTIGI